MTPDHETARPGVDDHDRQRDECVLRLKEALAEGLAQADRGELLDGPTAVADIQEAVRRRRTSTDRRE